jgi:hypothetical protein
MSKLMQTAKSRKFLVCALASAFMTLNWHFGWMPTEIALAIIAPFLGWVGVEGYMDAQKTQDGGVADVLKTAISAYIPKKPSSCLEEVAPLPTLDGIVSLDQLTKSELAKAAAEMREQAEMLTKKLEERNAAKENPNVPM